MAFDLGKLGKSKNLAGAFKGEVKIFNVEGVQIPAFELDIQLFNGEQRAPVGIPLDMIVPLCATLLGFAAQMQNSIMSAMAGQGGEPTPLPNIGAANES